MKIDREPAEWLIEWRRGLMTSYTDAALQALRICDERIDEQDLKSEQQNNIKD